jgi:hypothetical protein
MSNVEVKHLRNQIVATSVAATLLVYAIGVAIPALTAVPVFATDHTTNDHTTNDYTNDNANQYHHYQTDDNSDYRHPNYSTNHQTNDNDHNILLFLIDVIDCFTNNDEQFSDDVQQCLYDVIEVYFDGVDNNNLNNDNNGLDDNNNDISSNDNNDDDDSNLNNDSQDDNDDNDNNKKVFENLTQVHLTF